VGVVLALAAATWVALLMLGPVLPVPVAGVLYALASHICHQLPERSFHLLSSQLPVCARCLGIYAGAAAGLLLTVHPWLRHRVSRMSPRTMLCAGAVPTLITVVMEWGGVWSGGNSVRAAAGATLGLAVAFVVAPAAATLHYGECVRRRPIANNRPPTPI
jgi:uncharacterized membrane protein